MTDADEIGALYMQAVEAHRQGRLDEARERYEKLREILPDEPSLLGNLGALYCDLGDYPASRECLDRSLVLAPDQVNPWINLGNVQRQTGAPEAALASYDRAIALAPGRADVHNNKGVALYDLGRHDEAAAEFGRAAELDPGDPSAWHNLGSALSELGLHGEALACQDRAIALWPDYAEAHNRRGMALDALGRGVEAIESYRRAAASRPGFVEAWNNLGVALGESGRLEEARAAFRAALEVRPDYAEVHHNLSAIKTYAADDPQLAVLEAMAASAAPMADQDRVYLNFALGKAREDVGRYDAAFAAYAEANRLQHALKPYDEAAAEAASVRLEAVSATGRFAYPPAVGTADRVPVLIVGMPRSGTTLIEQVLSALPGVAGVGEVDLLGGLVNGAVRDAGAASFADWLADAPQDRLEAIAEAYVEQLWRLAPEARFIVDKTLDNYHYLGLVRLALPQARIVHALRDPMDSCFSCYAKLFTGNLDFSYDLGTLGRHYLRYMRLMRHWHAVLPAGSLFDLRYEDMVADVEGQARRLLDYLGLPWNPDCLQFHRKDRAVRTASLAQVRAPIYKTSVARWQRFADHLQPLLEIVRDERQVPDSVWSGQSGV